MARVVLTLYMTQPLMEISIRTPHTLQRLFQRNPVVGSTLEIPPFPGPNILSSDPVVV